MINSFTLQFNRMNEMLAGAKNILIASHQNPDPDAVASALTLNYVFKNRNFQTLPYLPDKPAETLSFLPGFSDIKTEIGSFEPDLIFCLDYGDFKRLKLPEHVLSKQGLRIITIDHHLESDQRGDIKILDPKISSTSEIIYYWIKHENIDINKDIASLLLSGMFSDSGGFCHVSTSAKTLNIVSELISKGASLDKIARNTLDFNKPLNLSRTWGKILSRTKIDKRTGLAYSWLKMDELKKFNVNLFDFDGITNIISATSLVNLGLLLIEYEKGKVKGSLRSEPQGGINVAELVKSLNGGGHAYAAGFSQEGTIEDVLKKVLNLIQ
ncbi:MAG: bifunctional oligoribonuclease/PAP phosphatase NrnA [Candidatus Nealsonbacteria bacterium]|nr:bifunctional oligoribonuclease/PAP phosphatase NrnA [Candidatus Nealsonbacteria bacterium]